MLTNSKGERERELPAHFKAEASSNDHQFSNVYVHNCSGGNNTGYGGGAGGISISYTTLGMTSSNLGTRYRTGSWFQNNYHYFNNVTILACVGGFYPGYGSGAGGLSLSFFSYSQPSESALPRSNEANAIHLTGQGTSTSTATQLTCHA